MLEVNWAESLSRIYWVYAVAYVVAHAVAYAEGWA